MRIGIIQVTGNKDICDIVEKEFEKEVSTLEIKRVRIPGISSAPLGARILLEDSGCDFAVLPYQLGEDEKLGIDFNLGISLAEFWLKKHIFRILVYPDEEPEGIIKKAVEEIIMYHFKPASLEGKTSEEEKNEGSPFGLFQF